MMIRASASATCPGLERHATSVARASILSERQGAGSLPWLLGRLEIWLLAGWPWLCHPLPPSRADRLWCILLMGCSADGLCTASCAEGFTSYYCGLCTMPNNLGEYYCPGPNCPSYCGTNACPALWSGNAACHP
jgi:hypothetical protein